MCFINGSPFPFIRNNDLSFFSPFGLLHTFTPKPYHSFFLIFVRKKDGPCANLVVCILGVENREEGGDCHRGN